jgi:hypothetical protein
LRQLSINNDQIICKTLSLIILHFLVISLTGYSQNNSNFKKLSVTGVVYDIESLDSLPFSKITINKSRSFVTDSKGYFNIKLAIKDTLIISHLGYVSSEIVISDLITNYDSLHINILLKEQIYNIPTVSVFPYKSYNEFLRSITKDGTNSQALNNAYENIKMMKTQIGKGYFPANDALTNYNYIMNYKPLSGHSIVLFSSPPNKGIIPALKKIIKK